MEDHSKFEIENQEVSKEYLNSEEFQKDKVEMQEILRRYESGEEEIVSHEDFCREIREFVESLK